MQIPFKSKHVMGLKLTCFVLMMSHVLFILSSCASVPPALIVRASGFNYVPFSRTGYVTASWYGKKFHGRPTASGERYDMYGMTAAHKRMKFGTRLRVTNPDNNRSVVVTVNDRGPFIFGRDLDLSYGAARAIGLTEKGVGRVKIEILGRDNRYIKRISFTPSRDPISGGVTIQVGSFIEKSRAFRLKQGLAFKYDNVYVSSSYIKGTKYYRVRIGKYSNYDTAYSIAKKLAEEGYSTFITSK